MVIYRMVWSFDPLNNLCHHFQVRISPVPTVPNVPENIHALANLLSECHRFYSHPIEDPVMQQMMIDGGYRHRYSNDCFDSFYLWHERFETKPKLEVVRIICNELFKKKLFWITFWVYYLWLNKMECVN